MKTEKIGVTCVYEEDSLIAIIHKDEKSRKNVFFKCEEMCMEELERLVNSDLVKVKNEKGN